MQLKWMSVYEILFLRNEYFNKLKTLLCNLERDIGYT